MPHSPAPPDPAAAFEVRGPHGEIWRVYEDGRVSGFPDGSVILNRIPIMLMTASAAARKGAQD